MAPLRANRTFLAAPYSMLTAASPYPDRCGSLQGSLFATVSPAAERIAKCTSSWVIVLDLLPADPILGEGPSEPGPPLCLSRHCLSRHWGLLAMTAPNQERPADSKPGVSVALLPARFLHQGSFTNYAAALDELRGWATGSGYPLRALAAWITVGQKIRVQLATRVYWQPLTPRGQAREALCRPEATDDLLCLEFERGRVVAHELSALSRAHGTNGSLFGAA